MKQLTDVVIFSLDRPDMPANADQRAAIVSLFDAKPALDMYQGETENSFVVTYKHFHAVKAIAKMFNQESILVSDVDGVRLQFLNDNHVVHLGSQLSQIDNIDNLENWTLIDGKFYAVS